MAGRIGDAEPLFDYLIDANGEQAGVGIGAQISQNAGIWYPTRLDTYVKVVRSMKYYDRYMDDTVTLHHDRAVLEDLLEGIRAQCDELELVLNPKKTLIIPLTQGITFLKMRYRFAGNGRLLMRLDNGTFKRERRKLRKWKARGMAREIVEDSYRAWRGTVIRYPSSHDRLMRTDALFRELFPDYDWRRK